MNESVVFPKYIWSDNNRANFGSNLSQRSVFSLVRG